MSGDNDSVLVQRLDVVQVGRRRRWSHEEKLRIVAESYQGHRQVSAVARRYDISRAQLYAWRRALGGDAADDIAGFSRAVIVPEVAAAVASCVGPASGRMEVVTRRGDRIIVGGDVEAAALARVLAVLEERR